MNTTTKPRRNTKRPTPSQNGHQVASEILDRLPPQDLAAEMNLLGSIGLEHGDHCRLVGGWDDYPDDCTNSTDIEADSPETLELYRAAVRFVAGFFGIRDRDEFERYLSLFKRTATEARQ